VYPHCHLSINLSVLPKLIIEKYFQNFKIMLSTLINQNR